MTSAASVGWGDLIQVYPQNNSTAGFIGGFSVPK
jgi:hypothetical protein